MLYLPHEDNMWSSQQTEAHLSAGLQIVPKNPVQALVDSRQPLRSGSMDTSVPALMSAIQNMHALLFSSRWVICQIVVRSRPLTCCLCICQLAIGDCLVHECLFQGCHMIAFKWLQPCREEPSCSWSGIEQMCQLLLCHAKICCMYFNCTI